MGTLSDVNNRLAKLEARRNPNRHLPDKVKTRMRVSRLYTRWLSERQAGNNIPPPELEPEEVRYWEYSELIAEMLSEQQAAQAAGYPRADISPELQARFDGHYERYHGA